jgi:hypothetical protein
MNNSKVNARFINGPDDLKRLEQAIATNNQAEIQQFRGGESGTKTWEQTREEVRRRMIDTMGGGEDTLRLLSPEDPNAAKADAIMLAKFQIMIAAAKESLGLRDQMLAAGVDAPVQLQYDYLSSIVRVRMIHAEYLGQRAAVARAMNQIRDMNQGSGEIGNMLEFMKAGEQKLFQPGKTPAEEAAAMKLKLDELMAQHFDGKTPLDIAKLHKDLKNLKQTVGLAKAVTDATKWDMVVEAWKAGLVSGPTTQVANIMGNEAFQVMRAPIDALGAMIGMARGSKIGEGANDRMAMAESVERLVGPLGGVIDGLKIGLAKFMEAESDLTGKAEQFREAIPGMTGRVIRTPFRLLGAFDEMFKFMYQRGEYGALAIRKTFGEDKFLPGSREFSERVQFLKDHPTQDMIDSATDAATRMTFNMPLGEKGRAMQNLVEKWNLQWMIPFIRTPANIAKEMLRMSPFAPVIGEWRAAMAKGGVERDRAIAEMAIGSGVMALTMAYAFQGNISGAGEPDPGKKRAKAGVWQQYSIKVGDKWYEYSRVQPLGTLMGLSADIAGVWDHMTEEEKDKVPKMLATAFANAITNQTFLQGITQVVNAMSDPTRFVPKFAQGLAGSVVPGIIAQPTVNSDPYVREVNSMLDAIRARLPGRQEMLTQRDWLGAEVQTKERFGMFAPVREQQISTDKVRLEADRLGISVAAAPKKTHIGKGTGKIGDIELTPEERDTFERVGGNMAHNILTQIVNAPGWDTMPAMVQRKIYAKVLQGSHQVAAVAALPMDKRVAYIQSISEKIAQELEPNQ